MNQGKSNEPFTNQIEEKMGGDFEYDLPPPGVHLMGLVKVKNKMRFNKFSNANEPSIQFTFRMKDNPKAYVNHSVAAKLNEKSNLFKLLQKMSNYKFSLQVKENNPQKAYYLIQQLDNSWFDVAVIHKPGSKMGVNQVYANIPDNQVTPARVCPNITPKEWFEQAQSGSGGLQPAIPSVPQQGQDEPGWLSAPEKEGKVASYDPEDDLDIPF